MKTIKYFIEFLFIKLFFFIFKIIGYKNASNLGAKIGSIFGPLVRSKSLIKKNIQNSLPNFGDKEIEILTKKMWENYGRIFSEYMYIKKFRIKELEKYLNISGTTILDKIKKDKKPVVFISGHFNNFELMAMQLELYGIELATVYRPLNNFFLNQTMEDLRKNYICKNQIKKGRSGTRQILENLKQGNSIALMIDQRVTEGIKINFFGDLASTTTIPAQIIKKYMCDLVPIYIERNRKYYFKMYVSQPIVINIEKSQEEISKHLNTILEKMILKNPDQWIWTHNRWKK